MRALVLLRRRHISGAQADVLLGIAKREASADCSDCCDCSTDCVCDCYTLHKTKETETY